jgi:hypothetical protein
VATPAVLSAVAAHPAVVTSADATSAATSTFAEVIFIVCAFVVFGSPQTECRLLVKREIIDPILCHLTNSEWYALGDPATTQHFVRWRRRMD